MEVNIGKSIRMDVDCDRFNTEVRDYIFAYGLKQILSDSHSSIKKDEHDDYVEKSRALAQKKLDAMYAGEVRALGDRTRFEPLEREARRMCLIDLQSAVRKSGKKLTSITTEQWAKAMDAQWEKYIPAAQEFLDKKAAAPAVDLSALGL